MPLDDDDDLLTGLSEAPAPRPIRRPSAPRPAPTTNYDPDSAVDLISHYESGNRNIKQQVVPAGGGYNPSVGRVTGPSTAGGPWQITNTTWRKRAPREITQKYPTAMSAPVKVQRDVARKIFQETGFQDWAPYNRRLAGAIRRGERVSEQQQRPSAEDDDLLTGLEPSAPPPTEKRPPRQQRRQPAPKLTGWGLPEQARPAQGLEVGAKVGPKAAPLIPESVENVARTFSPVYAAVRALGPQAEVAPEERARKQRVSQMGTGEYLSQVPKSIATGAASGAATGLKGIAALAKKIDFGDEYKGRETKDLATYRLGEYINKRTREIVGSNPDLEQDFFVGKAPETIGQAAQFMLGGWATKAPRLTVAILGAGMTAGDTYDEVRQIGGTDEEAVNAALLAGGLLGPTELIGMRGAMKALKGTPAEATVRQALLTALREGRRDVIENALQEVGQEFGQGLITGRRRSVAELTEAGLLGGIGGTATVPLSLGSQALTKRSALERGLARQPPRKVVAPDAEIAAKLRGQPTPIREQGVPAEALPVQPAEVRPTAVAAPETAAPTSEVAPPFEEWAARYMNRPFDELHERSKEGLAEQYQERFGVPARPIAPEAAPTSEMEIPEMVRQAREALAAREAAEAQPAAVAPEAVESPYRAQQERLAAGLPEINERLRQQEVVPEAAQPEDVGAGIRNEGPAVPAPEPVKAERSLQDEIEAAMSGDKRALEALGPRLSRDQFIDAWMGRNGFKQDAQGDWMVGMNTPPYSRKVSAEEIKAARNEFGAGYDRLHGEVKPKAEPVLPTTPEVTTPEQGDRKAKIAQLQGLRPEIEALAAKGDLTTEEANRYRELTTQADDIRFEIARPLDVSKIPPPAERQSTLPSELVVTARDDLARSKPIYNRILDAAHGVFFGSDTAIDRVMQGKDPEVSARQLYDAFSATREAMRKHYGDKVTLYRAVGRQKAKLTTNWATTREFAKNFGDRIERREVPIDEVLAVNVGLNGKYHEVIVGKPPKGTKQLAQPTPEPQAARPEKQPSSTFEGLPEGTDLSGVNAAGFLRPDHALRLKGEPREHWSGNTYEYEVGAKPTASVVPETEYSEFDTTKSRPRVYNRDTTLMDAEGTPTKGWKKLHEMEELSPDAPRDENVMYRGMSGAELDSVLKSGEIKSNSSMNLGDQVGRSTSFAVDPASARAYAAGFAPWYMEPTFEKPSYVVKVKRPKDVKFESPHSDNYLEAEKPVPLSDVLEVWEIRLARQKAGSEEVIVDPNTKKARGGSKSPPFSEYVARKVDPATLKSARPETAPTLTRRQLLELSEADLDARESPIPEGMTRLYRGGVSGNWFSNDRDTARFHLDNATGRKPTLRYVDVPTADLMKYDAFEHPGARINEQAEAGDYVLPKEISAQARDLAAETAPSERAPELQRGAGARKSTKEGMARVEEAQQRLRDIINNPDIVGRQRADMIANGKELIAFLTAHADTRKPIEEGVVSGDRVAFTNEDAPEGFRSFIYLEGHKAGEAGVTRTAEARDADIAKARASRQEQQEGFKRIRESGLSDQMPPARTAEITRARAVPKPSRAEKPDVRTGLTRTQSDFVAKKLEEGVSKLSPEGLSGGEALRIKVPDDGEFTVVTPEQASRLHQRVTGEPLEGFELHKLPRVQGGVKRAIPKSPEVDIRFRAEELVDRFGSEEKALTAVKKTLEQHKTEFPEDTTGRQRQEDIIERLENSISAKTQKEVEAARQRKVEEEFQLKDADGTDINVGDVIDLKSKEFNGRATVVESSFNRVKLKVLEGTWDRKKGEVFELKSPDEIAFHGAKVTETTAPRPKATKPTPEPEEPRETTVRDLWTKVRSWKTVKRDIEDGISYVADLPIEKAKSELESARKNWEGQRDTLRAIARGEKEPTGRDYEDWQHEQGRIGKPLPVDEWVNKYSGPNADRMLRDIERTSAAVEKVAKATTRTEPALVQRARKKVTAAKEFKEGGGEVRGSGGPDTELLINQLIVKGWDYYVETKPKFDAWAKEMRTKFGDVVEPHLRRVWTGLTGEKEVAEPKPEGAREPEPSKTSVKNAAMAADREAMGLREIEQLEPEKVTQWLDEAKTKNAANPFAPDVLIEQAKQGNKTFTDVETMQVKVRAQELKNRINEIDKEIHETTDPKVIAEKGAEQDALLEQFHKLDEAVDKAGTEWGRTGVARQQFINQSFELADMVARFRKAKVKKTGQVETPEERAEIKKLHEQNKALTEKLEAAEAKAVAAQAVKQVERIQRQRRTAQTRQKLDEEFVVIKSNIAAELARIRSGSTSPSGLAGLDPEGRLTRELLRAAHNRIQANLGLRAEALRDELHDLVKDGGISKRQIDEVLAYGFQRGDRRSEASKKLAELRAERKRVIEAEDINAGRRSERSEGPRLPMQGPKPSEIAQVREKEGPRLPKQGPHKTRVIQDLEKRITEWERKVKEEDFRARQKGAQPIDTPESRRLRDDLQRVKTKYQNMLDKQRPGKFLRNLSGIRKANILSGLTTQAKNFFGTAGWQGFEEGARVPAAIADMAMATKTGRRAITAPTPAQMLDSVIQGMRIGGREAKEIFKHGATKEQLELHQFSEIDTGVKAIDLAANTVFRMMSASDRLFYNQALRRNLFDRATAQAKNEGVGNVQARARELVNNPSPELEANAKHDALVSTFNNNNKFSDGLKAMRGRWGAKANFAVDMVMPFDRTPTNVLMRILEANAIGGGIKMAKQIHGVRKRGQQARLDNPRATAQEILNKAMSQEEQRQIAQAFGRATMGTGILALGWMLADKIFDIDEYGQVFINVPKLGKINVNTVSPVGNLLAMGANLKKQWKDPNATMLDVAKEGLRPVKDQPLLRGASELTEFMGDPDRGLAKSGARFASSWMPASGLLRDTANLLDEKERKATTFTERVKMGLPGLRETVPEKKDRKAVLDPMVTKYRNGRLDEDDLNDAVEKGTITESEAARIKHEGGFETVQEAAFDKIDDPQKALEKFEKMTPAQREQVQEIMKKKAKSLLYSPAMEGSATEKERKRDKLRQRLEKLDIDVPEPAPKETSGLRNRVRSAVAYA